MATVFPRGSGEHVYRTGRLQAPNVVPMPANSPNVRPAEQSAMEELA